MPLVLLARCIIDSRCCTCEIFFVALIHKLCVYLCRSNLNVNRARAITPAELAVEAIADVRVFSLILVVVSLLSSLALILKPGAALLHVT